MKKVLAMVLAVFMLVSVLCVGASADTAPAIVVDSVSAAPGQTVSVSVRTQNNPGICGLRVALGYDESVLTPVEAVAEDFGEADATFGPLTNPLSILWYDAIHPAVTIDGAVATIKFQVAENAPVGEYPLTLSIVDPEDMFDANLQPVAFEVISGAVTVADFTYGDVNNDGKINVRDLGALQQYINGWDVAITMAAADVNADGKLNVRDLGLLQQHINGWDVVLGGGTVNPPVDPDPDQPGDDDYEPIVVDGVIQNPKAGVAYKLGLNQTAKAAIYYFTGVMSGYYGATDTSIDNAVDMYLEDANGGYKLYFNDANGAKQYIKLEQSGTHYNFTFGAEGSVFTLDAEKNALCAPCGDQVCYMGTYGNYVTVGTLTTEKLKDTDYLARLYVTEGGDIGGGDQPVDPNPPVDPDPPVDPEPPVAGGVTIDFTDSANRVSYSTEQQVWAQNGITVTNDKAGSVTDVGDYGGEGYPARFYKTSALTIEYTGMTKIVFFCDDYKDTYAADLAASISTGTVSVDGTVVTVTFDAPVDSLFIEALAAQVRVLSIAVNPTVGGDEPVDPNPPVDPEPDVPVNDWTVATTLKDGVAYKLGLDQTAKAAIYYFTGVMSGYYGATETDISLAVDMYVETVDGGYKLYFNDASGAKQYIKLEQSGTHYNFTFGAEGSVFTLDADKNALCAPCGDQICYMGTYGNYVTVGTLTSEKLKDTDYIARLYTNAAPDAPVDPEPGVCEHVYFDDCSPFCELCGEEREVSHNVIAVEAKAATCSALGNIAFWYCDVCGQAWLNAECTLNTNMMAVKLPMIDHVYDDEFDADCNACGATREVEQPADPDQPGDAVVSHADFNTIVTSNANGDSSYTNSYTTADGWVTEYSAIQSGGASVMNPQFPVIGPDNTYKAVCLNGKVSAPGKITSPTLSGGISKLTISYTKMFTDTKLSATITITDLATGAVYTQVFEREEDKNTKYEIWTYEWILETPIAGDFTIEILNNCPTQATGNKDRLTILDIAWTSAGAAGGDTPVDPEPGVCEHTYDNACDADCNLCGETREVAEHVYDDEYDADCNECGATREVPEKPVDPTPGEPTVDENGVVLNPQAGVAYKLGLNQTAKGAIYYFTGVMSGYYGATDTAVDNAVDMFVEIVDGGYMLYFNGANGKQYIKLEQSGTHYNFTFGAEGSVFTLDTELNAFCTTAGDQICYMGTYGNYVTVGTLTVAKLKDTDYIARLYAVEGGTVTPPAEPDEPSTPDVPVEGGVTISFHDKANRTSYSTEQQVWAQNGITVTNDKAGSVTNVGDYGGDGFPVRFYKTSALTVEYTGMTKIVFNCDDYKDTYATDLAASITTGTASVSGTVVTVTFDAPVDSLFIEALAAQVRVDSIVVYA